MPPFRDEHLVILAPGSRTTLAQLDLPESFAPAQIRLKTRMFPTDDGKFEPYLVRERKKAKLEGQDGEQSTEATNGVDEVEYEEDQESDEGAIWPLEQGKIVNMPCFLAFLHHCHSLLSPLLQSPILLISDPAWTSRQLEDLTNFVFEKLKPPAFCIMDAALAATYGLGLSAATVIDVGAEKIDITTISEYMIQSRGTIPSSGGEAMTNKLYKLLEPKGFTRPQVEQLKRSNICEILPFGTPFPGEGGEDPAANPAAAASTGAATSGPNAKISDLPRGPGDNTQVGEEGDGENAADDEGVLDVASIVTSGKTQEFLAKAEKAKAEKAAKKANKDAADNAPKTVRLPNSKRKTATFWYEDPSYVRPAEFEEVRKEKTPEPAAAPAQATEEKPKDDAMEVDGDSTAPAATADAATTGEAAAAPAATEASQSSAEAPAAAPAPAPAAAAEAGLSLFSGDLPVTSNQPSKASRREERQRRREEQTSTEGRQELEVGLERFQAAEDLLPTLCDTIYRVISSVDDISKRGELWENLVIVGNGSLIRGFKEALLSHLIASKLVTPSTASIFLSELPSNTTTPVASGMNTPLPSGPSSAQPFQSTPVGGGSSVNPLLLAATTAANPALGQNLSSIGTPVSHHHHQSHTQQPQNIKFAKTPEYFADYKSSFHESVFLGALVAAKVIFVVDQGATSAFMSRTQYNENGPQDIHQVGLTY